MLLILIAQSPATCAVCANEILIPAHWPPAVRCRRPGARRHPVRQRASSCGRPPDTIRRASERRRARTLRRHLPRDRVGHRLREIGPLGGDEQGRASAWCSACAMRLAAIQSAVRASDRMRIAGCGKKFAICLPRCGFPAWTSGCRSDDLQRGNAGPGRECSIGARAAYLNSRVTLLLRGGKHHIVRREHTAMTSRTPLREQENCGYQQ